LQAQKDIPANERQATPFLASSAIVAGFFLDEFKSTDHFLNRGSILSVLFIICIPLAIE
jgi:hypothetical protein